MTMVSRYLRWLVLVCVTALVSCMILPNLSSQDNTVTPQPSQDDTSIVTTLDSDGSWLLRFPGYWVTNGRCQQDGTQTMLLSMRGDRLEGKLPWVWNNQHDAATLIGTVTDTAITMTLTPPSIGGFEVAFSGTSDKATPGSSTAFSGKVNAKDACQKQNGTFTLNRIERSNPDSQASHLPLFQKPFDLEFLTTNYFDHQVPRQFQDNNGYLMTWAGQQLSIGSPGAGIDGHAGYDWSTPEGTPLLSVADGVIHTAGKSESFFCPPLNQETAGLEVYIEHSAPNGDRFASEYIHLSRIDVVAGQSVKAGQVIGLSGNTGCSTGPHLHFGVYRISRSQEWTIVDPYGWTAASLDPWSRDADGAESLWLWKEGQAPVLYEYGR
ncbi:MAG: M23 family metallopeptidase [Cyanobacteria bacterium P01_E01_bin.6]